MSFCFFFEVQLLIILHSFEAYTIVIQYFYRFYPIKHYYKIMTIIPCVVQYILVTYLFYT